MKYLSQIVFVVGVSFLLGVGAANHVEFDAYRTDDSVSLVISFNTTDQEAPLNPQPEVAPTHNLEASTDSEHSPNAGIIYICNGGSEQGGGGC